MRRALAAAAAVAAVLGLAACDDWHGTGTVVDTSVTPAYCQTTFIDTTGKGNLIPMVSCYPEVDAVKVHADDGSGDHWADVDTLPAVGSRIEVK